MLGSPETQIQVKLNRRGYWEIVTGRGGVAIECDRLEKARDIARAQASRRRPCQIIVSDAYHRICHYEVVS